MFVVPPIIANNLGKIALTAAATTLGALGYAHRERIRSWFSEEDDDNLDPRDQRRKQAEAEAREAAQSLKDLHGKLTPDELNRKHAELLEKISATTATTVSEFKTLINDVHDELGTMADNFQGELDGQRREVRALGKELREAIASLTARQDTLEALVRGRPREERVTDGQGESPSSPAPLQPTGSSAAPGGKRKGNGRSAPDSRPA
ncbi:hypothetical protein QEG98_26175 [Myxococcus sp. MxC21-1]|uniref:hypothetical protein n=1 Tax=Myxococcus sp. MxC21-1 TaxID=3041439 RepID=UPI00292F861A|nr:hypothetical protein [Myxococcus sp. MxC21-1]WNZ59531.1 hypothetical protein QEG98_26175 [Myxococcus sp. MxC21-1]